MSRQLDPDEVVTAAVAVAFAAGLYGLTLEAVATRCGARVRDVARIYGNEEQLVARTFQHIADDEMIEARRTVLAHPSPVRQLRAVVEMIAEPTTFALDRVWVNSWSLGRGNRLLGAIVRDQEATWQSMIAEVVRRGVVSGDFLACDAEEVAVQILAMSVGVNAYSLIGYGSDLDRMRLLTAVVRVELGVDFDDVRAPAGPAPSR